MHSYPKRKAVAAAAVLCVACAVFLSAPAKELSWEVLFPGLPSSITITNASHNAILYILKQTHEPLFRRDDGQNYSSRVLRNWSRSLDGRQYSFCPDTRLRFNESSAFSAEYFFSYIAGVSQRYAPGTEILQTGDCCVARFRNPQEGFLEYLALYENAPTIKRTEQIEDGLGPFKAVSLTKDSVTLLRKRKEKSSINKIILHDYQGGADANLGNRNISDFNRIPPFDIPEWVNKEYRGFENIQLKSVDLAINHPDAAVRRRLYNCINVQAFRRAYFPKGEKIYDIGNVFPLGVPGAAAGLPRQQCEGTKRIAASVVLANWRDDNQETLSVFVKKLRVNTGINIEVKNYQPSELVKILHKRPRPYNLLVMGIDAVRPDYDAFLSPFFREKAYIDIKPFKGAGLYRRFKSEPGETARAPLAKAIADNLAEEGIVLPLYQVGGKFYYPKRIKNLEAGKGFLEYPEVAEFRW